MTLQNYTGIEHLKQSYLMHKHSFIILAIRLIKQVNGLVFISTCKNLLQYTFWYIP
jgi:hypothetical protein